MAIIENGYLRGQIGNLVNRKVGNKNVVQTKPSDKIRQTRWTEAASRDFGTASSAGALIRRAFRPLHLDMHDSRMHNRLQQQMQRVLRGHGKQDQGDLHVKRGNIQRLVDFQFNEKSHLYDYLYFNPKVSFESDGTTSLSLPAINAQRNFFIPKNCSHVMLKIEAIGFDFGFNRFEVIGSHEIELPIYSQNGEAITPQTLIFEPKDQHYDSIVVSLSILYITKNGSYTFLLNSEDLNPVGIIAAYNL
ncbi:hypothetical protein SAMN05660841_01153 [Sphingobacterium nematocida]|uniref:Uncharacterized protein n=1 Tax=Sphingobacterium nematocida TaxID=1513896 RepID=A0A1T5C6C0_9SPHI|nr:hypothetical protein [Sphingobacterium nematocida]SKB54889.1 hypothetical protein SAMN05660841_01153 [Sphingobacterium nematocida]